MIVSCIKKAALHRNFHFAPQDQWEKSQEHLSMRRPSSANIKLPKFPRTPRVHYKFRPPAHPHTLTPATTPLPHPQLTFHASSHHLTKRTGSQIRSHLSLGSLDTISTASRRNVALSTRASHILPSEGCSLTDQVAASRATAPAARLRDIPLHVVRHEPPDQRRRKKERTGPQRPAATVFAGQKSENAVVADTSF